MKFLVKRPTRVNGRFGKHEIVGTVRAIGFSRHRVYSRALKKAMKKYGKEAYVVRPKRYYA